jgi:molecular chaperone DnaK
MKKQRVIGIDLGTTVSEMCGVNAAAEPVPIKNAEGEFTTESVVYHPPSGDPVVGSVAHNAGSADPEHCVTQVKRLMGHRDTSGQPVSCYVGRDNKSRNAIDESATILLKLRKDAEMSTGETVSQAVITVPAYFNDEARRDTLKAAEMAGLDVLALINEPTAAAIAYGLDKKADSVVAVIDLGGGTFDISIIEIRNGQITVIAVAGDSNLGGTDWTMLIQKRIHDEAAKVGIIIDPAKDPVACAEIRDKAEIAKRNLSSLPETVISVNVGGKQIVLKYTRVEFERDSAELLTRMEAVIRKAFSNDKVPASAIEKAVLVGGATRKPMIEELVKRVTNKPVSKDSDPEMSIAMGAALAAAQILKERGEKVFALDGTEVKCLPDCKIRDVAAHALGVAAFTSDGKSEVFTPIIDANTPVPAKCTNRFAFREQNQSGVKVRVYQGSRGLPLEKCLHIADLDLEGLPPSSSPHEIRIEITYDYDVNGIVHVLAKDTKSGQSASSDLKHNMTR